MNNSLPETERLEKLIKEARLLIELMKEARPLLKDLKAANKEMERNLQQFQRSAKNINPILQVAVEKLIQAENLYNMIQLAEEKMQKRVQDLANQTKIAQKLWDKLQTRIDTTGTTIVAHQLLDDR